MHQNSVSNPFQCFLSFVHREHYALVVIPDMVVGTGLRMGVAGNQMVVHTRPGEGKEGRNGGEGGRLRFMNQSFRKVVNESLGVSLSLAKMGEDERVGGVDQLMKLNRQYRSSWSS